MDAAWSRTPEEVLAHFGVNTQTGLSKEQVEHHSQVYGRNGRTLLIKDSYLLTVSQNCPKILQLHYGS